MSMYIATPPPGFYRWPETNLDTGDTLALTAGHKATATLTGKTAPFPLHGCQGVRIQFAGAGADNDTMSVHIWTVNYVYGTQAAVAGQPPAIVGYEIECFGTCTATLSAAPYLAAVTAGASGRIADTIASWAATSTGTTPKGPGTVIETAYGSGGSAVYSPANDTPATLYIPHLGWPDALIVEIDPTGTTTAAFALIART